MKSLFIILFMILFLVSCTTSAVTPSRSSRQTIDSIYQRKTIALQPHMDSLCASQHEVMFKTAVDSIMKSRESEMNNLVR